MFNLLYITTFITMVSLIISVITGAPLPVVIFFVNFLFVIIVIKTLIDNY